MDEFYQCLNISKKREIFTKYTEGILLGKVTNIVKNKMNKQVN